MATLLGTSGNVYLGLVIFFMGFAAYMTGQAVASTWRPRWQVFAYGVLLGLAARFLLFALFQGALLSPGILVDIAVMILFGLFAYRVTHVSCMVSQYPWQYQRQGLWNYREKPSID